jgi:hypothetical protein
MFSSLKKLRLLPLLLSFLSFFGCHIFISPHNQRLLSLPKPHTQQAHPALIIFTFNLQARKKPHSVNSFTADSSGGKLFSLMTIVTPGKAF